MSKFEDDKDVYVTEAVHEPGTGRLFYQLTKLNGLKHAPPDGSPSYVARDDLGRTTYEWHAFDKEHRIDGPAIIITRPNSHTPMTEEYVLHGKPRPSEQGPYRIRRDEDGGIWQEEFAPGETLPSDLSSEPS